MEKELSYLGFFRTELNKMDACNSEIDFFQLFESFKGVFLRIIIKKEAGNFSLHHIYFHSIESDKLTLELFGGDLSVENIIISLKTYRNSVKGLTDRFETE